MSKSSNLLPTDPDYPRMDERFELDPATEMDLAKAAKWLKPAPPEPVIAQGEPYQQFIVRQTTYAKYQQDVVVRMEFLQREKQRLSLPKAPVGDDIAAAIEWITTTGETPIEMLVKGYRNGGWEPKDRIACAKSVMEYVHRKLPSQFDMGLITPEEIEKMAKTVKQVEKVLAARMREQKKDVKPPEPAKS